MIVDMWNGLHVQAHCSGPSSAVSFAEYSQAWDFRNTADGLLQVDLYSNGSKDPDAGQSAPLGVRVNQVSPPHTTTPLQHAIMQ